jgi:hypothetical protein
MNILIVFYILMVKDIGMETFAYYNLLMVLLFFTTME